MIIWEMYFRCGFYVSSLLDHDIIKYTMIIFPHYLGFLLYFLYMPCLIYLIAHVYQLLAGSLCMDLHA